MRQHLNFSQIPLKHQHPASNAPGKEQSSLGNSMGPQFYLSKVIQAMPQEGSAGAAANEAGFTQG
jgi:hypothetical protein